MPMRELCTFRGPISFAMLTCIARLLNIKFSATFSRVRRKKHRLPVKSATIPVFLKHIMRILSLKWLVQLLKLRAINTFPVKYMLMWYKPLLESFILPLKVFKAAKVSYSASMFFKSRTSAWITWRVRELTMNCLLFILTSKNELDIALSIRDY